MEKCLTYAITNREYLETRGDGLADIIKGWLISKGFDVLVYAFILGDLANIIVDYSFDENANTERLKNLTEQIFKRFNIEYELEENIDL